MEVIVFMEHGVLSTFDVKMHVHLFGRCASIISDESKEELRRRYPDVKFWAERRMYRRSTSCIKLQNKTRQEELAISVVATTACNSLHDNQHPTNYGW